MENKKPTFEESINIIDGLISKRKYKWNIHAISYMDFDDVSQIIRIHIYKKWNQYDPLQPLEPWVNKIISNQIRNLRRNVYDANARPCLRCAENQGNDLCAAFGKQCSDCPLYLKWETGKKRAYNVKLPLPIENHMQEVFDIPCVSYDLDSAIKELHKKMLTQLKSIEKKIYAYIYIEGLTEEETANKMGYTTSEKNRKAGYNNFLRIKKSILQKAKEIQKDIDFI
jgi:DNA-directed RNA polymerase specialized sigma24 family protein